jgi:hypothetical protein
LKLFICDIRLSKGLNETGKSISSVYESKVKAGTVGKYSMPSLNTKLSCCQVEVQIRIWMNVCLLLGV